MDVNRGAPALHSKEAAYQAQVLFTASSAISGDFFHCCLLFLGLRLFNLSNKRRADDQARHTVRLRTSTQPSFPPSFVISHQGVLPQITLHLGRGYRSQGPLSATVTTRSSHICVRELKVSLRCSKSGKKKEKRKLFPLVAPARRSSARISAISHSLRPPLLCRLQTGAFSSPI